MDPMSNFPRAAELVRKHRGLMVWVFLVVACVATLTTLLLPPKYSSSMRILIRSSPKDLLSTPDRAESQPTGEVSEEDVNSEVQLLTGYDVLRTAVIQESPRPRQPLPPQQRTRSDRCRSS